MNKKINKKYTLVFCALIIPFSIFINKYKFELLPDKYFGDGNAILRMLTDNLVYDKAYTFTANVFKFLNKFFHYTTLEQWSFMITILFSVLLVKYLLKQREYSIKEYVLIYANVVLLNIYAFGLSKDIIQFVLFSIIYWVISSKKIEMKHKMFFLSCILLYEAIYFRIYYGIMFVLMWNTYFIYKFFIHNKDLNKRRLFKILFFSLVLFFSQIYVLKIFMPSYYDSIINARSSVNIVRELSSDAVTMISDIASWKVPFFNFIFNYLINCVRIMLPVELINKGIKYIPFVIYQVFLTHTLFSNIKYVNKDNVLYIIIIISFELMSIIFEPDFGSFIRHECVLMFFFLKILNLQYVDEFSNGIKTS